MPDATRKHRFRRHKDGKKTSQNNNIKRYKMNQTIKNSPYDGKTQTRHAHTWKSTHLNKKKLPIPGASQTGTVADWFIPRCKLHFQHCGFIFRLCTATAPLPGPRDRLWKITIHIETGANSLVAEWTSTLPGCAPISRSWSGTAADDGRSEGSPSKVSSVSKRH